MPGSVHEFISQIAREQWIFMLWPFDSPTSLSHSVVLIMVTRSNERPFLFSVSQRFLGISTPLAGAEFGRKLILDFTVHEFHPVLSELTFTHF